MKDLTFCRAEFCGQTPLSLGNSVREADPNGEAAFSCLLFIILGVWPVLSSETRVNVFCGLLFFFNDRMRKSETSKNQ